jgi:hypothetical protein
VTEIFPAYEIPEIPAEVKAIKDAIRRGDFPSLTEELVDEMRKAVGYAYEASELPEGMSPIARAVLDEPDLGLFNVLDLLYDAVGRIYELEQR